MQQMRVVTYFEILVLLQDSASWIIFCRHCISFSFSGCSLYMSYTVNLCMSWLSVSRRNTSKEILSFPEEKVMVGKTFTHFSFQATDAERTNAQMQKMKRAHKETIGLQGTAPRGRPAHRARVWGEAAQGQTRCLEPVQDIVWDSGWWPSQLGSSKVKSFSNLDLWILATVLTGLSMWTWLGRIACFNCDIFPTISHSFTTSPRLFALSAFISGSFSSFLPDPLHFETLSFMTALFQQQKTELHRANNCKQLCIQHRFIYFHDSMSPVHIPY